MTVLPPPAGPASPASPAAPDAPEVVAGSSPRRRPTSPGTGRPTRSWPRRAGRTVGAVAGGAVLSVAFPPHDLWPLGPVSVAVLALLVRRSSLRASYALGVAYGLGFLVPLLAWTRVTGSDGWLVLSLIEAVFVGLLGPLCALAARAPATPLWIGTAWVVDEAIRGRFPFGGFPWGRLAFVQPSDGGIAPVTRLAAVGGAPLVTFAVAFAGGLLASAVLALVRLRRDSRTVPVRRPVAAVACLLLGALAVLGVGRLVPVPDNGEPDPAGASPSSATVAAVQGNVPRIGLDWMGQRRAVTRNHLLRTQQLAEDVAAGREPAPDLVLWPENASDLDPFLDPEAAALLDEASQAIDRPLLVGAVLRGPGPGHIRNAGLVWGPQGYLGQSYVKRHPVPFGEYLPGRVVLQRLVSRFADSLPDDFVPGDRPGVLTLDGPRGSYRLGDVICFEVAYDHLVRDVVDGDARILVVQTNNATFGRSGETYQQMAMSRLRSIEHGRSTVVVATSGRSALIRPNGSVVATSRLYTPDALVSALPLRSSRTVADTLGAGPEYGLVALGLVVPVGAALLARRRRHDGDVSGNAAVRQAGSGR